jgi:Polysaccharide lyase
MCLVLKGRKIIHIALPVALSMVVSVILHDSTGVKASRVVDKGSTDVARLMAGTTSVSRGRTSPALQLTSKSGLPSEGSDGSIMIISGIIARAQNANRGWSLNRPNAHTLRFEVRSGDRWVEENPNSKGVERSEVALARYYEAGADINVSYRFMIEPGPPNTAAWMIVGQFHQSIPHGSPPFALEMSGEHLGIVIRFQSSDQMVQKYVRLFRDESPIARGRYYAMDIHVRFGNLNDGTLSVWRDGIKIVDYHGPIGFAARQSYYWKAGVYRAAAAEPIAVVYQDLTTRIAAR